LKRITNTSPSRLQQQVARASRKPYVEVLGHNNQKMPKSKERQIRDLYETLFQVWGPQHWWPANTRFEVIVGAYLTQNTAWTNVERALLNLRLAGVLSLEGIRRTPIKQLEQLVRSAGYFRQKAQRLKTFVAYLDFQYGGSLDRMFARPTQELRAELLALNGVGPETADSILLYGGGHTVFVVDTYTRRVLQRHGILPANAAYEDIRSLFERALGPTFRNILNPTPPVPTAGSQQNPGAAHSPSRISLAKRTEIGQRYNEMHGLIVGVGKSYCLKSKPRCEVCPLGKFLS
jgi:endonuclease-3 related protein